MATARSNRRLALSLLALVVGMVSLAYASVPLYRVFCQVTGLGGETKQASAVPETRVTDRQITVQFNADVMDGLPWAFAPQQREMTLNVGEQKLAFYAAENQRPVPTQGMATYNVTPHKAGQYFNKIACFCFDEQTLEASQAVDMPESFFIDPAFADDPDMRDVDTITLSYTFFPVSDGVESTNPVMRNEGDRP